MKTAATMPAQTPEKFYLTTPIYYVNARPHIGHTYTTVVADVIARRKRALGIDTWFLTGTDEHGQKIERSAQQAGTDPQAFTDRISAEFRGLWDRMHLSYDDYIRTTEPRHKRGAQQLFALLRDRGYIYKGTYTGQYCVWDELYVDALPGSPCPDCGRVTETVSEENYFFKLSAFERRLLEYYDAHPEFIQPEARRNEVLAFVRGGLKDLSVSRTSFKWGIPVPGDEKHVIYVWLDALANYMTALGYGSDSPEDQARFARYWPADLHVIGKEISRFHCVYWPAFLLAAGLPLPKQIVAHGWLLFEQSKMSKSRGNIVRSETILDVLGADALRYFLLREIVFGQDGSFSFDALVQRYNADLANGYGNLVSRTLAMTVKYFDGVVPSGDSDTLLRTAAATAIVSAGESFDTLDFSHALEAIWAFVATVDGRITARAPWKLAASGDDARPELASILYSCLEAIRIITALVYPVLPEAAAKVWTQLGLGSIEQADLKHLAWGGLQPGTKLGELGPIFPRADKDTITRMQDIEAENAAKTPSETTPTVPGAPSPVDVKPLPVSPAIALGSAPAPAVPEDALQSSISAMEDTALVGQIVAPAPIEITAETVPAAVPTLPQITIDDFMKVELRVAQILVAERVPKADKLLRLEVDLGYERRQILAGLAEFYAPEALVGRKVVIVANLAPRKLRGLESNGMVVAASLGEGKPALASFLEEIEIGARLK
jgi:methionyl-tRNA synthetase